MAAKKFGAVRDLVKQTRAALKMSQAEFAKYIGGNLPTLQRWEAGTASPGGLMTARLIEAGVPVKALVAAFEKDAAAAL
jgi:DNA-binding transcriptional regulator YiaG